MSEEISLTEEEVHLQLFEAVERGDIVALKLLLEPPLTVNVIVLSFLNIAKRCIHFEWVLHEEANASHCCRRFFTNCDDGISSISRS